MENKKFFLTNKNIKGNVNNSKNLEKKKDKESFIYKKGIKKINNSSFDLRKDIKVNKNINLKKKEINFDSNNQQLYNNNINDGENFEKQNIIYRNALSRTQTSFFNTKNNCDYGNKIFKHDENLFDNEQYQIIKNIDNNKKTINNKEKDFSMIDNNNNCKKNKLEYNYINQNNSFCVSINNNYNYNLSLNNYNNNQQQDDRENKINWNKKLNIINEEKKRMRTEFINDKDRDKDYKTLNNKDSNEDITNKKRQLFKIKKIHSSYILNNNNKNKSSIVAFLKPNTNLQKTLYMKRINKKSNEINNNNVSNDDYKNNYIKNYNNNNEENKNKNKGKIKESNDLWSNDEDNSFEDKFTFNIKKNNINYNNNNEEICELDIPASNINLNINDQKTAQFPDVINKENCYKYIPQHLTKNNDSDNYTLINNNNNKQNEKKVYTKGRYDYLLLEESIKNEKMNNTQYNFKKINNFNSFNKDTENSNNSSEFNNSKYINGKAFVYSNKTKNKINAPNSIKPSNLFKNNEKNKEKPIKNNIEEIKLDIRKKRKKIIERDNNNSLEYNSLNFKNYKTINNDNSSKKKYFYNIDINENNNNILNNNFIYSKQNKYQTNANETKSKILIPQNKNFNQIGNNKNNKNYKKINERNYNSNNNLNINTNYQINRKFDIINNSFSEYYYNKLHVNPLLIYKKKAENNNQNEKDLICYNKLIKNENNIIDNNINMSSNKNTDFEDNYFTNKDFIFSEFLSSRKMSISTEKSINTSIKMKQNLKSCRIKKCYNYFIKLPQIINCSITKNTIIKNKNNGNHYKIQKTSICYFSKEYLIKEIIRPSIKSINDVNINNEHMNNDEIFNEEINEIKKINNNEEKKDVLSSKDKIIENENENETQLINNTIQKNLQPLFQKTKIMSRNKTDKFNKKNNRIINMNYNNNFYKNEEKKSLSKNKCNSFSKKNHKIILDSLSDEELNIINGFENKEKNNDIYLKSKIEKFKDIYDF